MTMIAELMTRERLVTIGPRQTVREGSQRMQGEQISHLLVVERGELVGMLCACDLELAAHDSEVQSVMSQQLITADVASDALEVAASMLERGLTCLPVTAAGELCGVVTVRDLARAGVIEFELPRCDVCGSEDHVRCSLPGRGELALCIECVRSSEPPADDDELGGGG